MMSDPINEKSVIDAVLSKRKEQIRLFKLDPLSLHESSRGISVDLFFPFSLKPNFSKEQGFGD